MNRFFKTLATVLVTVALAACGGGGGSAGSSGGGGSGGGGAGGGDGDGGPDGSPGATLSVAILNSAGREVSSIDAGGGFVARATLRDGSGAVIANRLVGFALSDGAIATLRPSSALTNSSGVAQVSIAPSTLTALGAATLTASATVSGETVIGTADFAASSSNLTLSPLALGSTSLPSGGNTSLAVTALLNGDPASGTPVNVTFSVSCGRVNSNSSSIGVTTNGSGVASASYTAVQEDGSLCSGPVTVNASSAGATVRTASINVAAPAANAITFVGAEPAQIFLAGSGATEQSTVRFRVLSGTSPLANQTVTFSLTVNPGGVGIGAGGRTGPVQATTNAAGETSVTVFSGSIPGPVRVRAALASDATVFSESQNLTVASGAPSQRFMSLSVQTNNIEGARLDGTATTLTVRVADRQGNAVEDGTVINFTAEGGQVASSCATAQVNKISSCSVDFISQNPRPSNGRVSILAFTNGTKDYTDNNANNRYDAGDTLVDIGNAYRDDDEDGRFNASEFEVPRGGAATCAGAGAPFPARANTCDRELSTTVRQQAVILFSSSQPIYEGLQRTTSVVEFYLGSKDYPLLPMPAGTTVTAVPVDNTDNELSCEVTASLGSPIVNVDPGIDPSEDLRTQHRFSLASCTANDDVVINVRSPSGLTTQFLVDLQ